MNAVNPADAPGGMEVVSSRLFAAPRRALFGAFRNPAHLAQWWGPKGFTNTFSEFDFRPGGAWRFVMHGPDGANYPNGKDFLEIIEDERIVFQHLDPVHRFRMTMTFEDQGGGTRLTWHMVFDPHPDNGMLHGFITGANEENFDRLAAFLAAHA